MTEEPLCGVCARRGADCFYAHDALPGLKTGARFPLMGERRAYVARYRQAAGHCAHVLAYLEWLR